MLLSAGVLAAFLILLVLFGPFLLVVIALAVAGLVAWRMKSRAGEGAGELPPVAAPENPQAPQAQDGTHNIFGDPVGGRP